MQECSRTLFKGFSSIKFNFLTTDIRNTLSSAPFSHLNKTDEKKWWWLLVFPMEFHFMISQDSISTDKSDNLSFFDFLLDFLQRHHWIAGVRRQWHWCHRMIIIEVETQSFPFLMRVLLFQVPGKEDSLLDFEWNESFEWGKWGKRHEEPLQDEESVSIVTKSSLEVQSWAKSGKDSRASL